MAETLRLVISVVVREALILLGTVVPGQLEDALAVGLAITLLRQASDTGVGEEVKVEAVGLVLVLANEGHAEGLLVELEGLLDILDAEHGMVLRWSAICLDRESLRGAYHAVGSGTGLPDFRSLLNRLLANDLNPVSIRVKDEGNVPHASICQLLLEFVTGFLDTLARSLDVVDADAGMAETTVRLLVAIDDGEVGVVLGAIVVSKLQLSVQTLVR